MALLPTFRPPSFQVARQTTGFPNFAMPQVAAAPTVGQGTAFTIPPSVGYTGAGPMGGWNYGGPTGAGVPFTAPNIPSAAPAVARGPSLTVNQAANRQVNQIIGPQLAAANLSAQQQNNAIRGFAQAMIGKLLPIGGQVAADYNQAIQQTGALGQAAGAFLQQANPTPQVQALLQSVNAPAAQQAQLAGQLGQTFAGGGAVANYLGGTVPSERLISDKLAAVTQARQYPTLAALRGQQDISAAVAQQAKDRAAIEATRGQLYATARQNIISNNLARQRQAESKREFGVREADVRTNARIKARAADVVAKYNALKATAKGTPRFDISASRGLGYRSDQYGHPVGGVYTAMPGFQATGVQGIFEQTPKASTTGTKLTSVSPGHTVIDQNGNVIYQAPAATSASSTRPINISPGHQLVSPDGKVLYTAPAAASASAKPHFFQGADGREYVATPGPNGTYSVRGYGPAKAAATKGAAGGLSAASWSSLVKSASSAVAKGAASKAPSQRYAPNAPNAVNGFVTVPGTGSGGSSYQQALAATIAMGPNTPRWQAKATQIVNAHYAEGDRGRPYADGGRKAAAAAASAAYDGGIAAPTAIQNIVTNSGGTISQPVAKAAVTREYYMLHARSPGPGGTVPAQR